MSVNSWFSTSSSPNISSVVISPSHPHSHRIIPPSEGKIVKVLHVYENTYLTPKSAPSVRYLNLEHLSHTGPSGFLFFLFSFFPIYFFSFFLQQETLVLSSGTLFVFQSMPSSDDPLLDQRSRGNSNSSDSSSAVAAAMNAERKYRIQWICFWILGTVNNFGYVVVGR